VQHGLSYTVTGGAARECGPLFHASPWPRRSRWKRKPRRKMRGCDRHPGRCAATCHMRHYATYAGDSQNQPLMILLRSTGGFVAFGSFGPTKGRTQGIMSASMHSSRPRSAWACMSVRVSALGLPVNPCEGVQVWIVRCAVPFARTVVVVCIPPEVSLRVSLPASFRSRAASSYELTVAFALFNFAAKAA
jgi:hypothetical protein